MSPRRRRAGAAPRLAPSRDGASPRGAWSRDESGLVAGAEAIVLGVLVFVTGSLLLLSMWTIVDAKLAVESAAREATRAVVESSSDALLAGAGAAHTVATDAAVRAMSAQRGPPDAASGATWSLVDVAVTGRFARCGSVTATVEVTIDTPRLPIVGRRLTASSIRGSHVERIEPYRAGLPIDDGGITC